MLYQLLLAGVLTAVAGFIAAGLLTYFISKASGGNATMKEIAGHIKAGAKTFLILELLIIAVVAMIAASVMGWVYHDDPAVGWQMGLAIMFGAFNSALASWLSMMISSSSTNKTAAAAHEGGISAAFKVAFRGGGASGLVADSIIVAGVCIVLLAEAYVFDWSMTRSINVIVGYSMGASLVALFARVGGGVFTKIADMAADLVAKLVEEWEEDDPRIAAVIADNVGDLVGDVAGMFADLMESKTSSIVSTMLLGLGFAQGLELVGSDPYAGVALPIALVVAGLVISIITVGLVRTTKSENVHTALTLGEFGSTGVMAIVAYFITTNILPAEWISDGKTYTSLNIYWVVLTGLISGVTIGAITGWFTSTTSMWTKKIMDESKGGPATCVTSGIAVGKYSTTPIVLVLIVAILLSIHFAGVYGVALAGVSMLSVLGVQLAVDAYGPISDNAQGSSQFGKLPEEVVEICDVLDSEGNSTAAVGKGFSIGSATLTSLALFWAFLTTGEMELADLSLADPYVFCGLLLGVGMPFLFSAFGIDAVGKGAAKMIDFTVQDLKRPGVKEGTTTPDYSGCVKMSTISALTNMVVPGLLALLVPVFVGVFWGKGMLGGLLAGTTAASLMMAVYQANAGGAWDNAKKRASVLRKAIQKGVVEGDLEEAMAVYKATVVGDTVGDPFKDTTGPALNILMKLMSLVALAIVSAL